MNNIFFAACFLFFLSGCAENNAQKAVSGTQEKPLSTGSKNIAYYIDVHNLTPDKVSFHDVMEAHKKDLDVQGKYDVNFVKFWVDEQKGKVCCLSQSPDTSSISNTHREAHGLVPTQIYKVSDGPEAALHGNRPLYLDVHELSPGSVTAKDVAAAHEEDLKEQKKNDVNFINYWVDEKQGVVMCLSEASDSMAVKKTHQGAHGLLPAFVLNVKQGE